MKMLMYFPRPHVRPSLLIPNILLRKWGSTIEIYNKELSDGRVD
jgi:hypothetical protein